MKTKKKENKGIAGVIIDITASWGNTSVGLDIILQLKHIHTNHIKCTNLHIRQMSILYPTSPHRILVPDLNYSCRLIDVRKDHLLQPLLKT